MCALPEVRALMYIKYFKVSFDAVAPRKYESYCESTNAMGACLGILDNAGPKTY